jgi:hypothetical protein
MTRRFKTACDRPEDKDARPAAIAAREIILRGLLQFLVEPSRHALNHITLMCRIGEAMALMLVNNQLGF